MRPLSRLFRGLSLFCLGGLIVLSANTAASLAEKLPANSHSTPPPAKKNPEIAPLQATITESRYLPPEMYGQWSVTANLIEANNPTLFNPLIYEIWVLEETGKTVTISNPTTGASATISVDKVEGNTATFHRMQYANPNERIVEIPTVTVKGDYLVGETLNKLEIFKNGTLAKGFYARYSLNAHRINPSRVHFGPEVAPMEFEIEKVQRSTQ